MGWKPTDVTVIAGEGIASGNVKHARTSQSAHLLTEGIACQEARGVQQLELEALGVADEGVHLLRHRPLVGNTGCPLP